MSQTPSDAHIDASAHAASTTNGPSGPRWARLAHLLARVEQAVADSAHLDTLATASHDLATLPDEVRVLEMEREARVVRAALTELARAAVASFDVLDLPRGPRVVAGGARRFWRTRPVVRQTRIAAFCVAGEQRTERLLVWSTSYAYGHSLLIDTAGQVWAMPTYFETSAPLPRGLVAPRDVTTILAMGRKIPGERVGRTRDGTWETEAPSSAREDLWLIEGQSERELKELTFVAQELSRSITDTRARLEAEYERLTAAARQALAPAATAAMSSAW